MKIKFFKMDRGKTVQPAAASGQVLHNITFFLTNAKKNAPFSRCIFKKVRSLLFCVYVIKRFVSFKDTPFKEVFIGIFYNVFKH